MAALPPTTSPAAGQRTITPGFSAMTRRARCGKCHANGNSLDSPAAISICHLTNGICPAGPPTRWRATARAASGWEPKMNWLSARRGIFVLFGAARTKGISRSISWPQAKAEAYGRPPMDACENLIQGDRQVDLGAYTWTNRPIYDLYEDGENRLWVATLGDGLFRFDTNGDLLRLTSQNGLPTDFVRCVMQDREGSVWVGTEGGGLCRLKRSKFQTFGVNEGLCSDQVMAVAAAQDGGLWIGTDGDGLDHWKNGRVRHYGFMDGLKNGHVWSVLQDHRGKVWAGTWDGIYELARRTHSTVFPTGKQSAGRCWRYTRTRRQICGWDSRHLEA